MLVSEKSESESIFGPLNPPKISEVEGLACVIIATRGFCARQSLVGLQGATCPRRATGPRGAISPAAKPEESASESEVKKKSEVR